MAQITEVEQILSLEEPTDGPPAPVGGSFLEEAHPGPAPHNPEVVEETGDNPAESLAKAIIAAAREPEHVASVPLADLLLLRETKNLAGCVSLVEVRTAVGHLSLGCGIQSALTQMLAVAEDIVLRLDDERSEAEVAAERVAFANAEEHVAEIRAALDLPPLAVGQVWRTVSGREFIVERVQNDLARARFTDGEQPGTAAFCLRRGVFYAPFDPQPHTIFHNMPIALVKAAPVAEPPIRPRDKTWIDDDFDKGAAQAVPAEPKKTPTKE